MLEFLIDGMLWFLTILKQIEMAKLCYLGLFALYAAEYFGLRCGLRCVLGAAMYLALAFV